MRDANATHQPRSQFGAGRSSRGIELNEAFAARTRPFWNVCDRRTAATVTVRSSPVRQARARADWPSRKALPYSGVQIGEFHVLRELGRGAMAVVYHARSMRTGVDVALKLLPPGKNAKQRERFRREAEALMILNHPNIVAVHGFGEFNGSLYMAMELIPGEGLDERLERLGPLPVGYAVELFVPLAKALGHAHERRIVHRDIKPSNVMISASGKPYLADFGLAKDADSQGGGLTMEGALVGTPGFWSPEQARADHGAVGPATDVYGLGATLYAALTGKPPITGTNLPEIVIAVQDKKPVPPHVLRPEVPVSLSKVCLRCLAKDPEKRISSGAALANALQQSLRSRGGGSGGRRRGLLVQAALTTALGLGGVGAWFATRDLGGDPPARVDEPTPPETPEAPLTRAQLLERGLKAVRGKDAAAARKAYAAVLELDPEDPLALIGLGQVSMLRKDYYAAIDYLDVGIAALPGDAEAYLYRGIAYAELEQFDKAQADLERARSIDPTNGRVFYNLGVVAGRRNEGKAALEHFDRAYQLFTDDEEQRNESLLNRGVAKIQCEDYEGAEADVRAAMAVDPTHADLHYYLGIIHYQTQNWSAAVRAFEVALEELKPGDERHQQIVESLRESRARAGL